MYREQQQFVISPGITKAVRIIIITTVAAFLIQLLVDRAADNTFKFIFGLSLHNMLRLYVWELVSYMFLHGGVWHILINMLVLYFFGCEMEKVLGTRRFVKLYFGCGIIAGFGWLLVGLISEGNGLCIGASGAVYGVMGAFAAMFPDRVITLLLFFVLPVSMTARNMVIGIGIVSLFLLFFSDGNVAHSAHLAGGIAGYFYGRRIALNPGILDGEIYRGGAGGGMMSDLKAKLRRRTMHIVEDDTGPGSEEVDRILEKISAKGIGSISDKERRVLEHAGEHGRFS